MIQRWINEKQYICFSIDELFSWQDRLDKLENDKSKSWYLFDEFLNEAENQLEYSEEFIKEMEEIHKKIENGDYSDFVKVDFYEDLFDDERCDNCKYSQETNEPYIGDEELTVFYCYMVDDLVLENGHCENWKYLDR